MTRLPNRLRSWNLALPLAMAWLVPTGPAVADEPTLPPPVDRKVDFLRDVRPIFARNCFECHGPEKRKGGLRLDRKAEALKGGTTGPAFEAGKSDESLLIDYVAGLDPDTIMPPKGDRLTAQQIGVLRAWIDQGAVWPDGADEAGALADRTGQNHWAFQPVRRPEPPALKDPSRARGPIDAFVLAKLEAMGVAPSPEADRTTLVRRLSLDLRGLPPSPEEVEQFLAGGSPDAYEHLVDRMLASPHFGERWGRHWLDLARYADSDGYEKDSPRPNAWRYRNWVIDALNRDLPFDRFTIEQLAGDLLPGASLDQKTATGFHRNTLTNREGGVDQEEFRVAAIVDRVNTTGSVWLGLTVACAQCHNHKYDPIKQAEFYGLFAFFNSADELDLPAPLPEEQKTYEREKAAFDTEHAPLLAALKSYDEGERPARQADWEKTVKPPAAHWSVLAVDSAKSKGEADLVRQPDGSLLVKGINPEVDTYTITAHTDVSGISAFRLEVLDDPSLPAKGPGRVKHGNFVLSEFQVKAAPREGGEPRAVKLQHASADFSQDNFTVDKAIDGDAQTGWAVSPQLGRRHVAVFETAEDVGGPGGTTLTVTIDQQYGSQHTIGRLRLSAIAAPRPIRVNDLPDDVAEALVIAADQRTDAQKARLAEYHRSLDPRWQELNKAVTEHAKKAPAPPASKVQTLAERAQPRTTRILSRGDFLRPGEEVKPHTLGVLPPIETRDGQAPTRLDLARWLVDPKNPMTARVTVNRMWRDLFGRALVATTGDFGTRGELPSHPELLDWLASEFVAKGWSQKAMIKEIVMSATYRQSSRHRPDLADRDPNNVWLARQNRLRLEAEVVRDVELSASGLLVPTLGGPSVRPPQPPGIADLTYAGSAKWVESQGADRYRRGLYTWFQRTSPYPMLMTFDAPDSNVCSVRRERSNTPLQALTLLNDSVFFECAQALGRRIVAESCCDCPEARIDRAFRLSLGRPPTDGETATMTRLYQVALDHGRAHPDAAAKLIGPRPPAGGDQAELAAWVTVGRTILNLDEFITRE